jgi:hypothetical protein
MPGASSFSRNAIVLQSLCGNPTGYSGVPVPADAAGDAESCFPGTGDFEL